MNLKFSVLSLLIPLSILFYPLGADDYDFLQTTTQDQESQIVPTIHYVFELESEGGMIRSDSPFNPENILGIHERELRFQQKTDLELWLHPWVFTRVDTRGYWETWQNTVDFSLEGFDLTIQDPESFWSLKFKKNKEIRSPGKVFKIGNLQDRLFKKNVIQGTLGFFTPLGNFSGTWVPGEFLAHDFWNPQERLLMGNSLGILEYTGTLGMVDMGFSGAWDGDYWCSGYLQSGVGDRAIVYFEGVFWSKPWVWKASVPSVEFKKKEVGSLQGVLGVSWDLGMNLGTLYGEFAGNFQGLNTEEWEDFNKLSQALQGLQGPMVPLAMKSYEEFMTGFRFLENSLWYGALHWEMVPDVVPGLEAGLSLIWSAPRDFLTQGRVSWQSSWGLFLVAEGRLPLPGSRHEFSAVPFIWYYQVQAGWKKSF